MSTASSDDSGSPGPERSERHNLKELAEKSVYITEDKSDDEKGVKVHHAIELADSYTASTFDEDDLEMIFSHLGDRSFDEWLQIFRDALVYHKNDVGIPEHHYEMLESLAEGPLLGQSDDEWQTAVKFEAFVIHEWSVYPEVRAVTRPITEDDDSEEYQGIRAVANGVIWGTCGSVIATFFSPRSPSISISSNSLQILIAFGGHLMARLPRIELKVGFGRKLLLNSGKPWSYREQMLAVLCMAVADTNPYAQYVLISQGNKYFYNFPAANSFGYIILLILSTSFLGFGVGGIFRAAIIYPSKMVYYSNLPTLALSRALVKADVRESINGWKLKRWEFFLLFSTVFFGWYWITNNLLVFIQYFNWICYAAPENLNVNAITGTWNGLSLNPLNSLDPSIFGAFAGVTVPVWAYINVIVGTAISFFAACIIWYTNVVNTAYFPTASNALYDNQGQPWEVSEVLNRETRKLDVESYQNYSLPYWAASNVVSYGSFFMIYPAGFLSGYLYYWADIWLGYKNMFNGLKLMRNSGRAIDAFNDAFSRRMQRYKEVPEWWFMTILLGSFGMAIGTVEGYRFTETPVWTIFFGIVLACVFIPIVSGLLARTTSSYETNVLYELIIGYALPGNGNALLVGKAYATNFFSQAENWITNQKMAHYAGIAPRTLFWGQCLSTLATCFVQAGIITWQLGGGINDMCNIKNKQYFRCQNSRTYFNASVMWGVIGPRRVFKAVYPQMKWCFLIGACYPIPFWVVRRFGPILAAKLKYKKTSWKHYIVSGRFLRNVDETLILTSAVSAGGNWGYTLIDFYWCLFFGLYVKKKYPRWWSKYTYLLTAACSNGIGWAGFFNFWATQYHHIVNVNWWGTNYTFENSDYQMTAVRLTVDAKAGRYFGPSKGTFP